MHELDRRSDVPEAQDAPDETPDGCANTSTEPGAEVDTPPDLRDVLLVAVLMLPLFLVVLPPALARWRLRDGEQPRLPSEVLFKGSGVQAPGVGKELPAPHADVAPEHPEAESRAHKQRQAAGGERTSPVGTPRRFE